MKFLIYMSVWIVVVSCNQHQPVVHNSTPDFNLDLAVMEIANKRIITPQNSESSHTVNMPLSTDHKLLLDTLVTLEAANRNKELNQLLKEFKNLNLSTKESISCEQFLPKFLSDKYGLKEFQNSEGGYVGANAILPIITKMFTWQRIGYANEPETLQKALEHTNSGGLALVIDTSNPSGEIAVILRGNLEFSKNWNVPVPKAMVLSCNHPDQSFVNQPLSKAFNKSESLKVYIEKKY